MRGGVVVCSLVPGCGLTPFDFLFQFAFSSSLNGLGSFPPAATLPQGFFEVKSPTNATAKLEDPDAPLAQAIDTAELGRNNLLLEGDARLFLFFNETGRITSTIPLTRTVGPDPTSGSPSFPAGSTAVWIAEKSYTPTV